MGFRVWAFGVPFEVSEIQHLLVESVLRVERSAGNLAASHDSDGSSAYLYLRRTLPLS